MTRRIHPIFLLLGLLPLAVSVLAVAGEGLDPAVKRQLDTFFSNFSEAGVQSFAPASLTDETLLDFALRHNYLNRLDKLKRSQDGYSVLVSANQVDATDDKYFGRTVERHRGAHYSVPMADGDAIPFSQIRSLSAHGDGQSLAEGVVYLPGGPDPLDVHGTPASWKRQGIAVAEIARFTAIIEKVRTGGKERWVLREYTLNESAPR